MVNTRRAATPTHMKTPRPSFEACAWPLPCQPDLPVLRLHATDTTGRVPVPLVPRALAQAGRAPHLRGHLGRQALLRLLQVLADARALAVQLRLRALHCRDTARARAGRSHMASTRTYLPVHRHCMYYLHAVLPSYQPRARSRPPRSRLSLLMSATRHTRGARPRRLVKLFLHLRHVRLVLGAVVGRRRLTAVGPVAARHRLGLPWFFRLRSAMLHMRRVGLIACMGAGVLVVPGGNGARHAGRRWACALACLFMCGCLRRPSRVLAHQGRCGATARAALAGGLDKCECAPWSSVSS